MASSLAKNPLEQQNITEGNRDTSPQGMENTGTTLDDKLKAKKTAKDVLELALRGVNVHSKRTELCDVAIEVTPDVEFLSPLIQQSTVEVKSYCLQRVDSFNRAFKHYGYGIDSSKLCSGLEEYSLHSNFVPSKTDFYHCSRHTTVPIYRYQLKKSCVILSRGLFTELRGLEVLVSTGKDEAQIQSSCEAIFKKYGSHVYVGDIHFGGVFSWGAQYSGVKKDTDAVKQAVEEAFPDGIEAPSTGSPSKDVVVIRSVKGGQSEAVSFDVWKKDLEENPEIGTLVDRGKEIVGIWDILYNHQKDFKDVENLSKILRNTWDYRYYGNGCNTKSMEMETSDLDEELTDLPSSTERVEEIAQKTGTDSSEKLKLTNHPREEKTAEAEPPQPVEKTHSDRNVESSNIEKENHSPQTARHQNNMKDPEHDRPYPTSPPLEDFDIFKHLDLEKYYPEGISISDVMKISEVKEKDKIIIADVPWIILQKIIMLDRQAVISQIHRCAKVCKGPPQGAVGNDDDDDDDDDLQDLSGDESQINPADVFLAIFSCCDLNLKQTIVEKMNQCRLAVPFLLPDRSGNHLTFSLWALRSTILSWRDDSDMACEASAVNTPLKVVSCLRLGRPQLSKSKLLNKVINDQVDETFLNVDSPNGDKQRSLSAGLVEASFSLPNGKRSETDSIDEVTLFLNLRNDGTQYDKQLMMLSHLSTVVLVCVDIADLSNDEVHIRMRYVHKHCKKVILILSGGKSLPMAEIKKHLQEYKQNVGQNTKRVFAFNADGEKNASQLKIDVRKAIKENSTGEEDILLTDKISQLPLEFSVDEMNEYCQKGKKMADKVMSTFDESPKSELLPLQQECWKEWCKLLKEKKRSKKASGDSKSIQAVGKIEEKMTEYRQKQEKICKHPNRFIESFIEGLTSDIDDPSIDFYMRWLEMYIDDISRKALPRLHRKYHEILHKQKSLDRANNANQKEIQGIEKEISNATIGIEHLMREIGQMYEAAIESKNEELCKRFRNLPLLAAKLLLKGHALEIMDGDASGVPLTWVQAVLTELENTLGEQKLLSLSVLGIQSSGKSTLLNTMFGLQFPVSAGRCTRGVYMQLLKVKEDSGLPFNYIAVLDSEGLRAAELGDSKYDHDNELATFVIGLGNVTLINIKGENVAEIKDILQIVSHAFLRMKMVNSQIQKDRSCVFIHQNVPAVDAKEKMMSGARKFQETLDQKTKEAAELENIDDTYCFNQVIKFDSQKHIWYFPDLWHGDPPMASINIGYHEHIVALKSSLLQEQQDSSPIYFGLSEMKVFIENMWNGVLADDFVFGFRNGLVAKAYNHLDNKYSQLKFELEVSAVDWFGTIKIDESEPEANLHIHCEGLKREAVATIRKRQEALTKELDKFIDSDSQKEIMVTWKEEKVLALQSTANILCEKLRLNISELKANHEVMMLKKKQQNNHKQELLRKAQKLAEETETEETKDEKTLRCEFDKMWTEWIGNVYHEKVKVDIDGSVADLLYDLFTAHHHFIKLELQERSLTDFLILEDSIKEYEISKQDLKFGKINALHSAVSKSHQKKLTTDVIDKINDIFRKVDSYLRQLSNGFKLVDVDHMLQLVVKEVGVFNTVENQGITMNKGLEIQLVAHVAKYFLQSPFISKEIRDSTCMLLDQSYPKSAIRIEQELNRVFQMSRLEGGFKLKDLRDVPKSKAQGTSDIEKMFSECDFELIRLSGKDSGFQLHDAKKILQKGLLNKNPDLKQKFPIYLEVQLVVHIARYAMRVFHAVQDNYNKKYSATAQLEDYKRTTWNHFLHTVRQTEKEVVAVEMMCDELEPRIKKQVNNSVQTAVFKEIVPHFFTKKKLIKVVLEDLADKQSFEAHIGYVQNAKKFILSWIEEYTDNFIFRTKGQSSWYVDQAEVFLTRLLDDVDRSMNQASKDAYHKKTISNLIRCFSKNLHDSSQSVAFSSTNLPDIDEYEVKDFDYIVKLFTKQIKVVQERVLQYFKDKRRETLKWDGNTPYLQICDSLWGCEDSCPFCNEPCTRSNPAHVSSGISHESIQHRPSGVALWYGKHTRKLVVENCNFAVQSNQKFRCDTIVHKCDTKEDKMETFHPFKDYKKFVANWEIHPSPDMDSSDYWRWYFCTYKAELVKEIDDGQEPDIPNSWHNITKAKAIESLFVYD